MSTKATTKQINEAANAHAKGILGDDQFKKNKDAAKCIAEDFKAGANFVNNLK